MLATVILLFLPVPWVSVHTVPGPDGAPYYVTGESLIVAGVTIDVYSAGPLLLDPPPPPPEPPVFRVENKTPPPFVVTNRTKKPAGCPCTDCTCAAGVCPACPAVAAAPVQYRQVCGPVYQLVKKQGRFGRVWYEWELVSASPAATSTATSFVPGNCAGGTCRTR